MSKKRPVNNMKMLAGLLIRNSTFNFAVDNCIKIGGNRNQWFPPV